MADEGLTLEMFEESIENMRTRPSIDPTKIPVLLTPFWYNQANTYGLIAHSHLDSFKFEREVMDKHKQTAIPNWKAKILGVSK